MQQVLKKRAKKKKKNDASAADKYLIPSEDAEEMVSLLLHVVRRSHDST